MSTTTGARPDVPAEALNGVSEEVARYVAAVRSALADRPAEEVDDLTGGMEADLTELLTERGGSLESALGSPTDYSVELRSAAGVPPAPPVARAPRTIDLSAWWAIRRARLLAIRERRRSLAVVWDFLASLRPAWWVLRGLALGAVVFRASGGWSPSILPSVGLEPGQLHAVLSAGVMVVLSVLYGRGLGPSHRLRTAVGAALGAFALVALVHYPFVTPQTTYVDTAVLPPAELSFAGQPVDNVYVYDRDGRRLEDVRLFDAQGRSLVLLRSTDAVDQVSTLPGVSDVYGQWWTNVYPRPWTIGGAPYAVNPQADPGSPAYAGTQAWSPPPSVAPLVAAISAPSTPTTGTTSATPDPTSTTSTTSTTAATTATTATTAKPTGPATGPTQGRTATP